MAMKALQQRVRFVKSIHASVSKPCISVGSDLVASCAAQFSREVLAC